MVWNWTVYCITVAAVFCQQNPELRQDVAQNYLEELSCVDQAVHSAKKYEWDNPDAKFEYACVQGVPTVTGYQPKRRN
jgi:hypothetical protein